MCYIRKTYCMKMAWILPFYFLVVSICSFDSLSIEAFIINQQESPTPSSLPKCVQRNERWEDFCYIPRFCRKRGTNTWLLEQSSIDALVSEKSFKVLERLWWYGNVEIVSRNNFSESNVNYISGTTFISTVAFGAAIYARYTAFPLYSMLEIRKQNKTLSPSLLSDLEGIPPINNLLHVLFTENQHKEEAWIKDFVHVLQTHFLIQVYNKYDSMFQGHGKKYVCINALLYSHQNTGVREQPLRWFPDTQLARKFRSMIISLSPAAEDVCNSRIDGSNSIKILQRKRSLQGEKATRILRQEDVASLQRELTIMDGNFKNIEVISFEDTSLYEQAAMLDGVEILISPHGNGMTNVVFLPPCSGVVELFPYNFASPVFESLSKRSGIFYRSWHANFSLSRDNLPDCMIANPDWINQSKEECTHQVESCLVCARNAAFIPIQVSEIIHLIQGLRREISKCRETNTHENLQENIKLR